MRLRIVDADYQDPRHTAALVALLDEYAQDPMGGGAPLSDAAREGLPAALRNFPGAYSALAFDGETPVGLINCFMGFSTFLCRPLLNIHDIVVVLPYRGKGVGTRLFSHAEAKARELGCCKMTLEVLEGNLPAQRLYRACGFAPYELDPTKGRALFWHKKLES